MATAYVLYNPLAGSGRYTSAVERLKAKLNEQIVLWNVTQQPVDERLFSRLKPEDTIVLCGGDGTLNCFANSVQDLCISHEILYYPCGSGNDFAREMERTLENSPFSVGQYIQNLPKVTVQGKTYRFLNGVGYGIDGYCCEQGDILRQMPGKKVDYTAIAIKGLLFHYKPTAAKVTVDGKTYSYKKVWLAPTMYGKYYGGGMIPTPNQHRGDGKLSVMILHDTGKLHTLMVFPSIFKGEHVKHRKKVDVFEGKSITVEYDRPTPLQIDGETVLNVTSYTASI